MDHLEIQQVAPGGPSGWLPIIAGLVLGLLGIGLPMIGVTINLWLGFVILAIAFALIARGCWIWEGKSPRRKLLRITTIVIIALVYFSLVGMQMRAQYKKDHPPTPPIAPVTIPPPVVPPTVIIQSAAGSTCANQVAQSGSQINCDSGKGKHDKTEPKR